MYVRKRHSAKNRDREEAQMEEEGEGGRREDIRLPVNSSATTVTGAASDGTIGASSSSTSTMRISTLQSLEVGRYSILILLLFATA